MTQELVVQLRDDLDKTLGDDIETRQFRFNGVDYELELSAANFELFGKDMAAWIAVSRRAKRKHRKREVKRETSSVNGHQILWGTETETWAVEHGYQWDKQTRDEIRQWARDNGLPCRATGLIPRDIIEAHYKATHVERSR